MDALQHKVAITQAKIDRYGRINGDNDIIHYDHDYAVRRGFRGTLAHGPHNMAPAAELGAQRFGPDWFTRGRLSVKWTGPVCPGDEQVTTLAADGAIEARVGESVVMVGRVELGDEG
jgi:acyl dehydratase